MTVSPELFRDILFSLSGLSGGAAIYALIVYVLLMKHHERDALGHILVKASWLLVVGTVFQSILVTTSEVPPTTEGWLYALGLAMGSVGFVMVARGAARSLRSVR